MSKENALSKGGSCFLTIFILIALGSLIALFFIFKRVLGTDRELLSLTLLPLVLGIIFELRRLQVSWSNIILKIVLSLASSLILAFIPGKKEHEYNVENHIAYFPFVFIVVFLVISITFFVMNKQDKKLTSKLTEGALFIQSLSVLYLIIDLLDFKTLNFLEILLLLVGVLFSSISTFHAFFSVKHTDSSKFLLSFLSSIIMFVFGIYYGIRVFQFEISTDYSLSNNSISFIQYFLFGTSAIYILRNAYFIFGFIPAKGESSKEYRQRKTELKKNHIERFSSQQLPILSSLFCLILVGGLYFLNFKFNWIPSYTMIWLVFTFFPFLIYLWETHVIRNEKIIQ